MTNVKRDIQNIRFHSLYGPTVEKSPVCGVLCYYPKGPTVDFSPVNFNFL